MLQKLQNEAVETLALPFSKITLIQRMLNDCTEKNVFHSSYGVKRISTSLVNLKLT